MKRLLPLLTVLLLSLAWAAPPAPAPRELKWEELVPKGWDPAKELKGLDLSKLDDADPRAMEAMQKLRAMWDNAPVEPALAGVRIRLPGFVIPLEYKEKAEQVGEFLLVPYFGACIHSPPPPANQIIHGVAVKPLGKLRSMDAVWVTGTLSIKSADTPWGKAGYRLAVDGVAPYEPPPPPKPSKAPTPPKGGK